MNALGEGRGRGKGWRESGRRSLLGSEKWEKAEPQTWKKGEGERVTEATEIWEAMGDDFLFPRDRVSFL